LFEHLASSDQGRDYLKENKLLPEIAALLKAEIDVKNTKSFLFISFFFVIINIHVCCLFFQNRNLRIMDY